jgi:hypothetical protein
MSALQKAQEIINGDREKTYGHPSVNLERIASYWDLYLRNRAKQPNGMDIPLGIQDVCQMMVFLKIARLQNDPNHMDSLVDAIGYFALIDRCNEEVVF